jgi:hypothetical protein
MQKNRLFFFGLMLAGLFTVEAGNVNSQEVRNVISSCRLGTTAGLWEGRCTLRTWFDRNWLIVQIEQDLVLTGPNTRLGERAGRTLEETKTIRLTGSSRCQSWAASSGYWSNFSDPGCLAQDLGNDGWMESSGIVGVSENSDNGRVEFTYTAGNAYMFTYHGELPYPTE